MSSDSLPAAAPIDLPPVLVSPPWTGKPKRPKPTVVGGLTAPAPRVTWLPGERESWLDGWRPERPPGTDWQAALARVRAVGADDLTRHLLKLAAAAPDELGRQLVIEAKPDAWIDSALIGFLAARFGVDALPHVTHHAANYPANEGHLLRPFLSETVAALAADWLVRLKTSRSHATDWLLRHGADAAEALIPTALGEAGPPRRNAEAALFHLAGRIGGEPVLAAAKRHGDAAAAAIRALLDTDPLAILPGRPKRLPDWAEASRLPPLLSRTGHRLPDEAAGHVVTMLSISRPDQVYAGVAVVREHCDPVALADFGWALFQAWRSARFPAPHDWAVVQLRWTADDHTLRKLAKTMRSWSMRYRVTAGLAAFAEREGHLEALYLDELTRTGKDVGLRTQADVRLGAIAERRGLGDDELRDRLLPDPGLDSDGRLELDFGPRRFRVGVDEELRPVIVDDGGKRRRSLPKPGVRDDARLATVALRRFAGLKQDLEVLLTGQLQRWEAAMCADRRWLLEDFDECFVRHRLLGPVARRLVWRCHTDGEATTFRVAEDGSFATVDEEEFVPAPGSWVSVPHPVGFADELAAWRELFADYEILQPFEQLNRRHHRLDADELTGPVLHRLTGLRLSPQLIGGLYGRHWRPVYAEDYTKAQSIVRGQPPEHQFVVTVEPGLPGLGRPPTPQTVTEVRLRRAHDDVEPRFDDLGTAVVSELVDELTGD